MGSPLYRLIAAWALGAMALIAGLMHAMAAEAAAHRHGGPARTVRAESRAAQHRPGAIVLHGHRSEMKRTGHQPGRASRRDRDHLDLAKTARHWRALIVIDPGHGGIDSGTVGRSGTLEKNVTLAEARELRRLLLATGRYRVMLTRSDDRYVSLDRRLSLASAHDVALLISLHADASPDHEVRGASVYIRAGHEADPRLRCVGRAPVSPRAIARALRAGGASDPEPGSEFLQSRLVDSLDDDIRMTHTPTRADRLYVLANKDTPSVLVEMGFLSNRKDEALLRSPRYHRVIASAIRDALDDYFAAVKTGSPQTYSMGPG